MCFCVGKRKREDDEKVIDEEYEYDLYECEHKKCYFRGTFDKVSEHEKTCGWLNPEEDTIQRSAPKSAAKTSSKSSSRLVPWARHVEGPGSGNRPCA